MSEARADQDPRRVVCEDLREVRELAKGTRNEPELLGAIDQLADDLGLPTGPESETRAEVE